MDLIFQPQLSIGKILTAGLITLILLGLTVGLWKLTNYIFELIDDHTFSFARGLKKALRIKPDKKLPELIILRFVCYAILLSAFIFITMLVWGATIPFTEHVLFVFLNGFTFANINIIPFRILFAFLCFALLLLLGRFLAARVAKKHQFEGETDTQVAVASIVLYTSFAIAAFVGLIVTGVNFTGLAIIAGALSLGIGLGFQTIVNNFASGLILLLEKPIKPGDRVIVGTTEGFVKRIRIRSTQITTLAKEDVIIPNADLITNPVTNYMFRDRLWRVVCTVGVAYGSDTALVKQSLLEVASKHKDVLQEAPNKPVVLFRQFGESGLIFDLWCIIQDVNKKFVVTSDLNFAIDDAFRQQGIVIAFPQRDIHIIKDTE